MSRSAAEISTSVSEDLGSLSGEWEALAERLGAAPFVRPGWIEAWWRAFGGGTLQVLTAHRGRQLEAVLPIVVSRTGTGSPSNSHSPEFGLLSANHGAAAALLEALFGRRARRISLRFLARATPELDELTAAAERAGYGVFVRTVERSPRVLVEGDWESYEKGLSRNLRHDVERCQRRLERLGSVSLDTVYTTTALPEAFALERSGWKARRGTAISSQPETRDYYTRIAHWAAARGWLRLMFLRVDERPVAVHLAIEHRGAYFPLKGGFDPAFRHCSPGKLMIHATLRRAFETGLARYEFLGGDEPYKRRWATHFYDRVVFEAFAPTAGGRVQHAASAYARPLAGRVLRPLRRVARER